MKKLIYGITFILSAFLVGNAQTIDEVKQLVDSGEYSAAVESLEPILAKSPKDGVANFLYGKAAKALGMNTEATQALTIAADNGNTDAYPLLVQMYISTYDIEKAKSYIADWRAALKKAKKNEPEEISAFENRLLLINNQLGRIEAIPVFARYDFPAEEFTKALATLNSPSEEKGTLYLTGAVPFFINNTEREVFFTKPDANGINRLFIAGILDDGSMDEAEELTQYVGGGNILAPFMLDDGETLYFASDGGRDGLGGYDLYMTRRDGNGGFYSPSSLGMPYNSPGNDYLFVIDEEKNIGWWATDRFSATSDTISILAFVPGESRINVPRDIDDIRGRALITDIKATQNDDFDASGALSRFKQRKGSLSTKTVVDDFSLSLGNGKVYTSIDDFRSDDAAALMANVLDARQELNEKMTRLAALRLKYGEGDKSVAGEIRTLEVEVERLRAEVKNLTNRVIQFENRR